MYAREGGFIDGIDRFDAQFFRISPREAQSLDPQQRLLLEVVWEAFEDAGQSADAIRGSDTGFFMGLSWHDYERNVIGMNPERLDAYAGMGNTQSIAVGRLAFVLGAHGPTMQLDTACSASLTAVHLACQSLRLEECRMVAAGGANLMISPLSTIFCSKIRALSPDSRCKTFDISADGYARGEGCGAVVLKRLSDAVSPFRRNAMPHGWSSPLTTGTTRMRGCSAVWRTTGRSGGGSADTPRSAEAPARFWASIGSGAARRRPSRNRPRACGGTTSCGS